MTSRPPSPPKAGAPAGDRGEAVAEPGAPPGDGASVLDIGGDVGALVVYLGARPPGGELEACPAGEPSRRFHTGVHERRVEPRVTAHVAVFPAVTAGAYDVLDECGAPMAWVRVAGGEVSELDLR